MNKEEAIKKLYFLFNECEPVVDFKTDEKLYREKSREQLESHNTVLNLIEKQDKIINKMAEKLKQLREASLDDCFIPRSYRDIDDCLRTTCEDCIKEYFENKIKEDK